MQTEVSLLNYPDLSKRVHEIIRHEILTGQLLPGQPLQVVALAQQLGVSRTPVKEALGRLAAEGLVDDLLRKGFFVTRLYPEDIVALQEARQMIELAAVRRGIQTVTDDQLAQMERLLAEMESLIDEEGRYLDYAEFAKRDSDFHELIVATAGNRHLVEVLRRMSVHLHVFRMSLSSHVTKDRPTPTVYEHRAILKAFVQRDLPTLEQALSEHVENVISHIRSTSQVLSGMQARPPTPVAGRG